MDLSEGHQDLGIEELLKRLPGNQKCCLIRHHVNLRSKLFDIRDRRDLPIPVEDLDDVQVTVYREPGSNPHSVTNHFKTENIFKSTKNSKNAAPVPKKWIGQTIFQITAAK